MTLLELKQKADPILVDFWVALKAKQDAYFTKHGKYFQLLVSPTTEVIDGADSTFTIRKPTDEKYEVDVSFSWASKIPFQIEVHEWVGEKDDKGYMVIVNVSVGKDIYRRIRNSKNEDTNWFKLEPKSNICYPNE
jgi:hypothetical protein